MLLTGKARPRYHRRDSHDAPMTPFHTPRLCIGLPVYNGEPYLAQAIESLLAQTFTDFRLVIGDNGSTDHTEDICRSYARRDGRIRYHRSPENRGAAWNFNRLVALADSEYFMWAAHDDLRAPRFAERCIDALDLQPGAILSYPTSQIIDEHGTVVAAHREPADVRGAAPSARFRAMLWNWGLCHMLCGVIRLAVLRATQLHGAYPASDAVLLAELALRGEFCAVDEPLFLWRDHAQRATRACNSDAELAAWFAPANAGRMHFRHLTLFVNYLRTIGRVALPLDEKLRCWGIMARWFVLQFPTIQDEVRGNIARPVRRAVRRSAAPSQPSDSTPRAT
jgi:glycosyltransferase involved in cell wall biosynthesis